MGSNPALATPEDGGRLVDIAVEDISAEYTAFAQAE
jgi:creatinine amidohydrolase/Fe(II)-dependent formamide hydrolase-like protein